MVNQQPFPQVSAGTRNALLDAYVRLRSGSHSGVTNGRLTIANVALEAGCSRATAYRCIELTNLLSRSGSSTILAETSRAAAEKERLVRKRSTERELRAIIKQLLNRIVLMEAREKQLLDTVSKLGASGHANAGNVISLGNRDG